METRKLQLLLHPLLLLSLACLLFNDFYWKYEYHNWLTGKLSDFTGLFVLSVYLFAFFPKHRIAICFSVIVFFIWWKTPLSQPLINLLNSLFLISVDRTVDYSDYVALPAVFAPYYIKTPRYKFSLVRRVAMYFISAVCLVAFCSTSIIRKFTIAPDFSNRVSYHKEYSTTLTHADILHRLDSMGWSYKMDSFTTVPVTFYGGSLLIRSKDSLEKNLMIIEPDRDTVVYVRINEWRPYISLYNFKAGNEIFPQVNIVVNYGRKKNAILLQTVFLNERQMRQYYDRMSRTKKSIRQLIERELIRKLK